MGTTRPATAGRTIFFEADNLDVLPWVAERAEVDRVDVIYIDPPYNTGNDFAYNDRHGIGRRRHADWLAMMRPRLEAARDILSMEGALFCSIDDNEVAHLRLLLDEIFGERQFIAQVVVNLNPKGRQLGSFFATSHEYLLVYARDIGRCRLDASSTDTVNEADFGRTSEDGRRFRYLPLRNTNKKFNPATSRTLHYPLYGDPDSGRVAPVPFPGALELWPVFGDGSPAVWRWSAPRVEERPDDLVCRRIRGKLGERVDIFQRDWLHPGRRKKLRTIWTSEEVGSTDTAVAELKRLVGPVFESPKPTGLLRRVLDCFRDDAVVLDFFAGSGTTGHATLLANRADGGQRTSISINAPEPTRPGSNADLAGYATVGAITRARLQAAIDDLGAAPLERPSLPAIDPRPSPGQ